MGNTWRCPECETINTESKCIVCGASRPNENKQNNITSNNKNNIIKDETLSIEITNNNANKHQSKKALKWLLGIVGSMAILAFGIFIGSMFNHESNSITETVPDTLSVSLTQMSAAIELKATVLTAAETEPQITETASASLVSVPDMTDLTENEAINICESLGLTYEIKKQKNDSVDKGKVVSQSIPAGADTAQGTKIFIIISDGIIQATNSENISQTTYETSVTTTTVTKKETINTETASVIDTNTPVPWNETKINETLYVKEDCYSSDMPIVGSEKVKKYSKGTKIKVVAETDTSYCKLADGTFIHIDYLDVLPPQSGGTANCIPDNNPITDRYAKDKVANKASEMLISANYTKSYKDRYPYRQLSSSEKQLYKNIVEAAENFNTEVTIPNDLTSDDVFKVYMIVFNNEPQLFWLSNSVPTGNKTINLKFEVSNNKVKDAQEAIEANVKYVMKKVSGCSSTVSKIKVIHEWVITHNKYSTSETFKTCGIYNGLTGYGNLNCQGYAKTVQYLCDIAGIDCMTVTGSNSNGDTCFWNVVYCDNGYYILDASLDDLDASYETSDDVRYLFFLTNDASTKNSHINVGTIKRQNGSRIKLYNPPECTKTACYYFNAYAKAYEDLDSAIEGMYAEFDDVIINNKQIVHIKVADYDTWKTFTGKSYQKKFQDYAKSKNDTIAYVKCVTKYTEDLLVVEYDIIYD